MLEEFIMLISVTQVVGMEVLEIIRQRWSKKQRANLSHFFKVRCLDDLCPCRTGAVTPPEATPDSLQAERHRCPHMTVAGLQSCRKTAVSLQGKHTAVWLWFCSSYTGFMQQFVTPASSWVTHYPNPCLTSCRPSFPQCNRSIWWTNQKLLNLREDGKSMRAIVQTLAIATTTTWNVLKKKETTGVLSNRRWTG